MGQHRAGLSPREGSWIRPLALPREEGPVSGAGCSEGTGLHASAGICTQVRVSYCPALCAVVPAIASSPSLSIQSPRTSSFALSPSQRTSFRFLFSFRSHVTPDYRDVKPHNVLLSAPPSSRQFGKAVLTDLGSVCASRCTIQTRQEGLVLEEEAALKSSAAYRAPELTSVRPPVRICEGADVWSLGCTMFSLAFGRSPFEDGGGVQRLGILNGRYQYPLNNSMRDCKYSAQYVQLVNDMLQLEPSSR